MEDEWCVAYHHMSKLSIGYWYDVNGCGDEDDWRKRVAAFLEFIKPYCSSEIEVK